MTPPNMHDTTEHDIYPPNFESRFLSGRELWGDVFGEEEIARWFAHEENAYAEIGDLDYGSITDADEIGYAYAGLNWWHGWRRIPSSRRFRHALGIGSAHGGELLPVADRTDRISILEPAAALQMDTIRGRRVDHIRPTLTGVIDLPKEAVDLITCFGVLHHIPNVSTVVGEMGRVSARGGVAIIREPIGSMGDWRYARKPGITPRERGIPPKLLLGMASDAGFIVKARDYCGFPLTRRLKIGHRWAYNSKVGVVFDHALSELTGPNYRYNPTKAWQKVAPTSVFLVLEKR
jgi:hypothetical protein